MKNFIKNLFRETNKRLHNTLLKWLDDPEYRANLFVDDITSQLIKYLDKNNISYKELSDKAGKSRSAITQFLNSDSNVRVKTLFQYADLLDLTFEHTKITKKEFTSIYNEIDENEFFINLNDINNFDMDKEYNIEMIVRDLIPEYYKKKNIVTYSPDFYAKNKAS